MLRDEERNKSSRAGTSELRFEIRDFASLGKLPRLRYGAGEAQNSQTADWSILA